MILVLSVCLSCSRQAASSCLERAEMILEAKDTNGKVSTGLFVSSPCHLFSDVALWADEVPHTSVLCSAASRVLGGFLAPPLPVLAPLPLGPVLRRSPGGVLPGGRSAGSRAGMGTGSL